MDVVASEKQWMVLTELAQLLTVEPGQQFTTNQVVEVFDSEAAAVARALEVGWVEATDDDI